MINIKFDFNGFLSEIRSRSLLKDSIIPAQISEYHQYYAYCGFDPTAKSLHIGHLVPFSLLALAKKYGAKSIGVIGSATAEIGDPTDKNEARKIMTKEEIAANAKYISQEIKRIGGFDFVVNNKSWLSNIKMLQFLKIAMDFSLNTIVKMQTFEQRLANNSHLSVGEIMYPLLQAYDWAMFNGLPVQADPNDKDLGKLLNEFEEIRANKGEFRCIQVSGSDQYGNMVQGAGYIKKVCNIECFGITCNLLTMKSGEKMGKSVSGALYLNPNLVLPYDFFQAIVNFDDESAKQAMLKLVLDMDTETILAKFAHDVREAKFELAYRLTERVHGKEEAEKAAQKSRSIFYHNSTEMIDSVTWTWEESVKLKKLIYLCGMASSISDAERAIQARAVTINRNVCEDPNKFISKYSIGDEYVISYGKKHKKIKL